VKPHWYRATVPTSETSIVSSSKTFLRSTEWRRRNGRPRKMCLDDCTVVQILPSWLERLCIASYIILAVCRTLPVRKSTSTRSTWTRSLVLVRSVWFILEYTTRPNSTWRSKCWTRRPVYHEITQSTKMSTSSQHSSQRSKS